MDWLTNCFIGLTGGLIDLTALMSWLVDWLTGFIVGLTDRLDWLVDWLSNWFMAGLMDGQVSPYCSSLFGIFRKLNCRTLQLTTPSSLFLNWHNNFISILDEREKKKVKNKNKKNKKLDGSSRCAATKCYVCSALWAAGWRFTNFHSSSSKEGKNTSKCVTFFKSKRCVQ